MTGGARLFCRPFANIMLFPRFCKIQTKSLDRIIPAEESCLPVHLCMLEDCFLS